MNPVLSETNAELSLTAGIEDTSFSLSDEESNVESDVDVEAVPDHDRDAGSGSGGTKKVDLPKVVVHPHQKRKEIRSQLQGFSQMAKGISNMAEAPIKRAKMTKCSLNSKRKKRRRTESTS